MGLRALIREFINEITAKRGTSPYDTEAEVLRVENGKAWVRIPGGVPETPVDVGMNAEEGDIVTVRVSGGKAWLQNNITHPATDDKTAKAAQKLALSAGMRADAVQREADKLIVITNEQGEQIGYAITTANGKNKTYHQASEPTGGEYADGDVWFDTDDDNKMYRWNGSSWAAVVLGDDALESISASKITAGTIDASQITVSNLDAGNITSGYLAAARIQAGSLSISKTDGLQTALDNKAGTDDAVFEEQLIYISKASGTSSVSGTTTWITESGDVQNTWTTKRPTYNSSYPVLFVAKQNKKVDGTVSCTTPVKDDTTTVIDGGHITTGTIDASVVTVTNLNAANITSGYLNAARIEAGSLSIGKTSGLQSALDDAGNTADNYLTEISGYSGISVHEAGDEDNFANVSSNGFLINGKVGGVSALAFRTYRGSFGTIRTQTASFNQATINYGYTEATFSCSYKPKMVLSVDFENSQGPIQTWAEQPHKGENMSIRIDETNKKVVVSVDLTKYSGATLISATIKYTSTNAVYSQLGYFPEDPDEHLFTIGNGYQDYSNAFTVDYDGDVNAQGTVKGNLEYCFLPPNSTYFQYYESNSPIMFKCSGNVCELRGAVKPYQEIAGSNTEYTICTLSDSKYYPSSGIKVTMHGSNRHEWLLRINTTGTVTFSRLADPAQNSYIAAGTSEWLPFHVTWLI